MRREGRKIVEIHHGLSFVADVRNAVVEDVAPARLEQGQRLARHLVHKLRHQRISSQRQLLQVFLLAKGESKEKKKGE